MNNVLRPWLGQQLVFKPDYLKILACWIVNDTFPFHAMDNPIQMLNYAGYINLTTIWSLFGDPSAIRYSTVKGKYWKEIMAEYQKKCNITIPGVVDVSTGIRSVHDYYAHPMIVRRVLQGYLDKGLPRTPKCCVMVRHQLLIVIKFALESLPTKLPFKRTPTEYLSAVAPAVYECLDDCTVTCTQCSKECPFNLIRVQDWCSIFEKTIYHVCGTRCLWDFLKNTQRINMQFLASSPNPQPLSLMNGNYFDIVRLCRETQDPEFTRQQLFFNLSLFERLPDSQFQELLQLIRCLVTMPYAKYDTEKESTIMIDLFAKWLLQLAEHGTFMHLRDRIGDLCTTYIEDAAILSHSIVGKM